MEKTLNKRNKRIAKSEMTQEQEISLTHELPPSDVVGMLLKNKTLKSKHYRVNRGNNRKQHTRN